MTDSDRSVRESVKHLFVKHVAPGNILDFGGGTGLDISWLLNNNYDVFFLEPSENMRSEARKNAPNDRVKFLESNTDFRNWSEHELPVDQKVNGILANFAVLNCIESIDRLFEKLSHILNPGGYIVATVIDPRPSNMARNYSILSAIKMLLQRRLTIYNKYQGNYHPTYIHSLREMERLSIQYFNVESITPLDPSGFVVMIFKKK